jgi:hypothetical protein
VLFITTVIEWCGENISFLSVLCAIAVTLTYIITALIRGNAETRDGRLIGEAFAVGFAAGQLPAAVFIMLSGLHSEYLKYLESEAIQLGLGGVALTIYFVQTVYKRFESTKPSGSVEDAE